MGKPNFINTACLAPWASRECNRVAGNTRKQRVHHGIVFFPLRHSYVMDVRLSTELRGCFKLQICCQRPRDLPYNMRHLRLTSLHLHLA